MFSSYQLKFFLVELAVIIPRNEKEEQMIATLRGASESAIRQDGYLWFVGDWTWSKRTRHRPIRDIRRRDPGNGWVGHLRHRPLGAKTSQGCLPVSVDVILPISGYSASWTRNRLIYGMRSG